jgi:hypothetical protein
MSRVNISSSTGVSETHGGGTDAVFLASFADLWTYFTLWTMGGVAVAFFVAGVIACRTTVAADAVPSSRSPGAAAAAAAKRTVAGGEKDSRSSAGCCGGECGPGGRYRWVWLPLAMMALGAVLGFLDGALPAALIAALYHSIPYAIGIDVAGGIGIGQALIITYFHLGRADFIHR